MDINDYYRGAQSPYDAELAQTELPELDPKDERLIVLSSKNGYLLGRNSRLEENNHHLEVKNEQLQADLKQARKYARGVEATNDDMNNEIGELLEEIDQLKQQLAKNTKKGGKDAK